MIEFNLKEWLTDHSDSWKRVEDEFIFTHATGHTSILLLRDGWRDDVLRPKSACLQAFYENFLGASIGDGQIIIGTPVMVGLSVSHNFRIPDLEEMANQSKALGMPIPETREVFIMEACWMFLYAIDQTASGEALLRYDRDFQRVDMLLGIQPVLEDWWQMIQAEPKKQRNNETH